MNGSQIVEDQKQRGVVNGGVRTKYNYVNVPRSDCPLFELETPIESIDELMMDLGRRDVPDPDQYYADNVAKIREQSFGLTYDYKDKEAFIEQNLKNQQQKMLLRCLLAGEMPHAIYRVRLMPDRLILMSYSRSFAVGKGGEEEIELAPGKMSKIRLFYPQNCCDKSHYATVEFCGWPQIGSYSGAERTLIRLNEYRRCGGDEEDRLVRVIESKISSFYAGYLIEVRKIERINV